MRVLVRLLEHFTDCSTDFSSATAERVVVCPSHLKRHAALEELTLMVSFHSKTHLCCDGVVLQLETTVSSSAGKTFVKALMCTDGLEVRMLRGYIFAGPKRFNETRS